MLKMKYNMKYIENDVLLLQTLSRVEVIKAWNNLPLSTDFTSVNAFKRSISKTDLSEYLKYDV